MLNHVENLHVQCKCAVYRVSAELDGAEQSDLSQGPQQHRDRLIREKRLVEVMCLIKTVSALKSIYTYTCAGSSRRI